MLLAAEDDVDVSAELVLAELDVSVELPPPPPQAAKPPSKIDSARNLYIATPNVYANRMIWRNLWPHGAIGINQLP